MQAHFGQDSIPVSKSSSHFATAYQEKVNWVSVCVYVHVCDLIHYHSLLLETGPSSFLILTLASVQPSLPEVSSD